jgi:hypothetical protein
MGARCVGDVKTSTFRVYLSVTFVYSHIFFGTNQKENSFCPFCDTDGTMVCRTKNLPVNNTSVTMFSWEKYKKKVEIKGEKK